MEHRRDGERNGPRRQERLLERLEAQVKVWRDLLFGQRQAASYLTPGDQRQVAWGAAAASAGLVLLVGLVVWRRFYPGRAGPQPDGRHPQPAAGPDPGGWGCLAYLSNWQNWSALLATLSSVVAVLTGVVKGLSGWLWSFHQRVNRALTLRKIQQRTYRDYRLVKKERPAANPPQ